MALFLRKKWSSRFSDFSLPKYKDENEGYHPRCVKTFLNVNEQVSFGIKSPFENNVRMYALVLQDEHMLEKISGIDFLAKEVWYHAICRSNYQSRTDNIIKKSYSVENNVWHDTRKSHSNTFSEICSLVQESVIEKETVYFMSELTSQYKSILLEKTGRR